MDLISVIVPIYNVEKYLRRCLDSLLAQTYKNIEVIMVDDGSPDNCGVICDEYVEKYGNFIAVHKENAGLGMARNTGLDRASGQYVFFIDSDDYISDSLIGDIYKELKTYHVDVCISGLKRTIKSYKSIHYEPVCYPGEKARTELLPRMLGSLPNRKDSIQMSVCGILYNAELIRKYKLRFPSERNLISEDLIFNIDYMQHANGVYVSSNVGYFYNVNPSSLTRSYRSDRFRKVKIMYQEVAKRLKELHYDDSALLRNERMFFVNVKGCIVQETIPDHSRSLDQKINKIRMICKDETVQHVIRIYPTGKLGFAQKVFLFMVQHAWVRLLYCYFLLVEYLKMNK